MIKHAAVVEWYPKGAGGGGSRSALSKTRLTVTLSTTNPTRRCPESSPSLRRYRPANCLSCDTALNLHSCVRLFLASIGIAPWMIDNLYLLLIPWSGVLLENVTGLQLVKKFPAFYGTRRFITAFTSARHLSLSWAISIQSIAPHPLYLQQFL
jgi:hypothetical protein